jgi:NAD(P)-dependent dehydrogenase (short-subunit alcohol dehydrogenase family)
VITIDLQETTVVVTGGTRGLGKAIGMEFARAGANVVLTHRWHSVDEAELRAEFRALRCAEPIVMECDASDPEATRDLVSAVLGTTGSIDVVVSNVAFSKVVDEVANLKRRSLELSLGYSSWPVVDIVQTTHELAGRYPRYVIGVSSDGGEVCHPGYDLAGASKAVLETLCRYLAIRLKGQGVRVNAVRPGFLDTQSSRATFGDAALDAAREGIAGLFVEPRVVAQTCLALCSGLLDGLTGQVITVDEGWSLVSPLAFVTRRGLPEAFPGSKEKVR